MTVQITQLLVAPTAPSATCSRAGGFLLMAVPLIVFFALQRYFVQGLLAGSVK